MSINVLGQGADWLGRLPIVGSHTAVAADASAGSVSFPTPAKTRFIVQVFRSNVNIGNDVKASLTAGVLKVESGSTYKITAGDVINWIAY